MIVKKDSNVERNRFGQRKEQTSGEAVFPSLEEWKNIPEEIQRQPEIDHQAKNRKSN